MRGRIPTTSSKVCGLHVCEVDALTVLPEWNGERCSCPVVVPTSRWTPVETSVARHCRQTDKRTGCFRLVERRENERGEITTALWAISHTTASPFLEPPSCPTRKAEREKLVNMRRKGHTPVEEERRAEQPTPFSGDTKEGTHVPCFSSSTNCTFPRSDKQSAKEEVPREASQEVALAAQHRCEQ